MTVKRIKVSAAVSKQDMIENFLNSDWLWIIYGWVYGSAMGKKVESGLTEEETSAMRITPAKWSKRQFKDFVRVLDKFHRLFPQKKKKLYRLLSQPKNSKLEVGKAVVLKPGLNSIQSWTDNLKSAEQFHKDVYKTRPERGRQYLIVSCYAQPITTTATIAKVLEWLCKNLEKLHEQSADTSWINNPLKARRDSVVKLARTMLVRLNSKMLASQREQIVYAPKPIRVIIEKVYEA